MGGSLIGARVVDISDDEWICDGQGRRAEQVEYEGVDDG